MDEGYTPIVFLNAVQFTCSGIETIRQLCSVPEHGLHLFKTVMSGKCPC